MSPQLPPPTLSLYDRCYPSTGSIHRYHSRTPYYISPDQEDAIIRTAAFHRTDFDRAVIWFSPRTHCNSVKAILPASHVPKKPLGHIDRLPLELINEICRWLDVLSIFHLRQTNVRARQVVDALREYQILTTLSLNPLSALLRTGLASCITLREMSPVVYTEICSLCNDQYGDLVYLPTWIRCCSRCLREDAPKLRTASLNSTRKAFRLTLREIYSKLQTFESVPGIYTMNERSHSGQVVLASTEVALLAFEGKEGIDLGRLSLWRLHAFKACCALPTYNLRTQQFETGVSCGGCQLAIKERIISGYWAGDMRDKVYSRREFLEHFVWCEQAQNLWLESEDGTVEPPKLPYICKAGGYFKPRE